eukprot:5041845-Alexandrium_andersonii.AAC.1
MPLNTNLRPRVHGHRPPTLPRRNRATQASSMRRWLCSRQTRPSSRSFLTSDSWAQGYETTLPAEKESRMEERRSRLRFKQNY